MILPRKCLVDTNVPIVANLATIPDSKSDVSDCCILKCIQHLEKVTQDGVLVLDDGGEIFNEYINNLSLSGQPGQGDAFAKWVNNHQWNPKKVHRITITKNRESYDQFPTHASLTCFDNSDRKFIAVANAHPDKPPILQATDSKWFGWKDALSEVGIMVHFLCPDYVQTKYAKKMES